MAYEIEFAASVRVQLQVLPAKQRAAVLDAVTRHLVLEPLLETRNRKLLRPNPIAPWELRVGQLRVFYELSSFSERAASRQLMESCVFWRSDRKRGISCG